MTATTPLHGVGDRKPGWSAAREDTASALGLDRLRTIARRLKASTGAAADAVNLVPSETRLSPLARLPLRSDAYNRYFFNDDLDPGFWQFRGGEDMAELETAVARPALSRLGRAEHVNVRPVSGMSAMLVVLSALAGSPGDDVISISPRSGGHYATSLLIRRLGHRSMLVDVCDGGLDQAGLRWALRGGRVSLVYLDMQNSLQPLAVEDTIATVRELSPRTLVHVDCSHTLGLILGGALPNSLDAGADSMGGSTHKTFPGPHKGVLFTRDDTIAARLREAQFFTISSHHFAETIALGLASAEFEHFGSVYAQQVIANAQRFAQALMARGFEVVKGAKRITETHQVWVRIGDAAQTNRLSEALARAGVRVNIQDDLPGLTGPTFRLGLNEFTFQGADASSVVALADVFTLARQGRVAAAHTLRRELMSERSAPFYFAEFGVLHDER